MHCDKAATGLAKSQKISCPKKGMKSSLVPTTISAQLTSCPPVHLHLGRYSCQQMISRPHPPGTKRPTSLQRFNAGTFIHVLSVQCTSRILKAQKDEFLTLMRRDSTCRHRSAHTSWGAVSTIPSSTSSCLNT